MDCHIMATYLIPTMTRNDGRTNVRPYNSQLKTKNS